MAHSISHVSQISKMSAAVIDEHAPLLPGGPASTSTGLRDASPEGTWAGLPLPQPPPPPHGSPVFARGSLLTSVVNICSATMGVGALALPFAMSKAGLALGIALLLVAAAASIFSILLLAKLVSRTCLHTFEQIGYAAFGAGGELCARIAILVFCVGTATACIIAVGELLPPVTQVLLPQWPLLHRELILQLLLVTCVMLPMSFVRHLSSLRVMTLLATLGVIVLALIFGVKGCAALAEGSASLLAVEALRPKTSILLAVPTIAFAYVCQVNVLEIYSELEERTPRKMYHAVMIAVGIETLIYVIIGASGYMLFGAGVHGNVLRMLDINQPVNAVAQLCIGTAIVLSFPLNIFPARETLLAAACAHAAPSRALEGVITVLLVFISLLLAVCVPSISVLFSMLGSTTGLLIAFIFPAAFYLVLSASPVPSTVPRERWRRGACWIMLGTAVLLLVFTTARSVEFARKQLGQ